LTNVTILNRDAFEIINRIEDKEGTAIYIDPPYLIKNSKYIHDFTTIEHITLATFLNKFKKTRIVISYYEHPALNDLYPNWKQHKIDVSKAMSCSNNRGENDVRAVEVLLTNTRTDLFDAGL
jgi:DNA adenine methylase